MKMRETVSEIREEEEEEEGEEEEEERNKQREWALTQVDRQSENIR